MGPELLVNAFVVGAAMLALWLRARLGARAPESLTLVTIHLVLAFITLAVMPLGLGAMLGASPSPGAAAVGLFAVFLPAMTYVLLTALWLFERLQRLLQAR